jgi:hypothetical protein
MRSAVKGRESPRLGLLRFACCMLWKWSHDAGICFCFSRDKIQNTLQNEILYCPKQKFLCICPTRKYNYMKLLANKGRAIAQAVSRRLLTEEALVRAHVR